MEKYYKRISIWGRILGVMMMIPLPLAVMLGLVVVVAGMGELPVAVGLIVFLMLVAMGVATFWIGRILFKSGQRAKEYLEYPSADAQDAVIDQYADYLFAHVVYTIAVMVAVVPIVFIGIAMGISAASY